MIYQVHILKRYGTGPAHIMKTRAQAASSDFEAIRIVKENFHVSAPPTASGFSLRRRDGMEIYRWFKTDAQSTNGQ
jgi:hypothetical protein